MSEVFANATYRLEDGREFSYHVAVSPKSELKQFEKDCYDSGFFNGVKLERERILTQWQYEMNECACEDAMEHMERRIKAELINGKAE